MNLLSIHQLLEAELDAQAAKHGDKCAAKANPDRLVRILAEEVGEVARAVNDLDLGVRLESEAGEALADSDWFGCVGAVGALDYDFPWCSEDGEGCRICASHIAALTHELVQVMATAAAALSNLPKPPPAVDRPAGAIQISPMPDIRDRTDTT